MALKKAKKVFNLWILNEIAFSMYDSGSAQREGRAFLSFTGVPFGIFCRKDDLLGQTLSDVSLVKPVIF